MSLRLLGVYWITAQASGLVRARDEQVEKRDDGALKLRALVALNHRRRERTPHHRLANRPPEYTAVHCNRGSRSKAYSENVAV